jgi:hypothetical protein
MTGRQTYPAPPTGTSRQTWASEETPTGTGRQTWASDFSPDLGEPWDGVSPDKDPPDFVSPDKRFSEVARPGLGGTSDQTCDLRTEVASLVLRGRASPDLAGYS